MPFRIKDLTVDLTSATAGLACPLHTIILCQYHCTYHFPTYCFYHCTFQISPCHYYFPTYVPCPANTQIVTCPGGSIIDPGDIVTQPPEVLKARLQEALKAVEAQQQIVDQSQQPQTLADVDMLEKKLTEALEELKKRRSELQKGSK